MASPSTGPPGPRPDQEPARESLLDLADLDAGAKRRRRRRGKMLTGLVTAGFALAGLLAVVILQIPQIGPAIRAAHGEGTRGELTLQHYGCGRISCTWTGVFVAGQGRLILRDVAFNGHVPAADPSAGVAVPALYSGDPGTVYQVTGSNAWIADVALLAFEVVAIVSFGGVVAYGVRTRLQLRQLWRPMAPAEREALQRRQGRFSKQVDRRLQRQRHRPGPSGRGRHTPH
jgi:hypothetical protein